MKTNVLTTIVITVSLIVNSGSLFSQKSIKVKNFPESLPKIELEEKTPQKYLLLIDNQNFDIYGNPGSKSRITAEYTRGFKNDSVKWNNVRIAQSRNFNETFTEGEKQSSMENYSYVVSDEVSKGTFFKVTPETDLQIKTLAWDMFMFEIIAWNFWDALKLNIEYSNRKMNSLVQFEGLGTIENKDMLITWTGVTKKNGKLCAIIQFNSMNNPLNFNTNNTEIKGRAHFWGNTYVSLSDKQIEYGELYEDVLMDIITNGQEPAIKAYATKKLTLEKIY
jgi:hypothetical protein